MAGQKEILALLVRTDGTLERVVIPPGQFQQVFREKCEAQYYERLMLADDIEFWVDEEGFLVEEPDVNLYVTAFRNSCWRQNPDVDQSAIAGWPPVAGHALFTGGGTSQGHTLGLTEDNFEALKAVFESMLVLRET